MKQIESEFEQKNRFFNLLDYKPLSKQLLFHKSDKKFRAYLGGLGSGKTHAGVYETLFYALKYPGILGFVLAPTMRVLEDSTIRAFIDYCPPELIEVDGYNRTKHNVKLINGTEILFRNCEDTRAIDRLRNIQIGWFWGDEARGFPGYAWKVVIGRLRAPKAPLNGWITSTTKGYNWIYDRFHVNPGDDSFYVISSSRENKHLPKGYVESLLKEYTGVFAMQEIEGKFVKHEGLVYPKFDRQVHIGEFAKNEYKYYVFGLDFGITNPNVLLVIGVDNDNNLYIVEEFYKTGVLFSDFKEYVKNKSEEYKPTRILADPSNKDFILDLKRQGVRISAANNEVMPGITKVNSYIDWNKDKKPKLFVDKSCVNTIREFENYSYPEEKEGKEPTENPEKVFDHCLDALRYIILSLERRRGIKTIF